MARVPPEPRCISCGYSLAGLSREALCPECAFPVARSLDATPLLRTAEPRWLGRVASGLRALDRGLKCWLIAACIWLIAILAVSGILEFLGLITGWPVFELAAWCAVGLAIAGLVLAAHGLWATTSFTPGPHAPPVWVRRTLRWAVPAVMSIIIGATVVDGAARSSWFSGPGVIYTLRAAVQIGGLAGLLAFSRLLQHFEQSLPDPRPDLRQRVRNTHKNLFGLVILFILGWFQAVFSRVPVTVAMPLGFAPILLFISALCFGGSMTRVRRGVEAERALAEPSRIAAVE